MAFSSLQRQSYGNQIHSEFILGVIKQFKHIENDHMRDFEGKEIMTDIFVVAFPFL